MTETKTSCQPVTNKKVYWLAKLTVTTHTNLPEYFKIGESLDEATDYLVNVVEVESLYYKLAKFGNMEDEMKSVRLKAMKERKFFEWRGRWNQNFFCLYLVEGTADKYEDDLEFVKKFEGWSYSLSPGLAQ